MANSKFKVKKRISPKVVVLTILCLVLSAAVIFLLLNKIEITSSEDNVRIQVVQPRFMSFENSTMIRSYLPAVDPDGNGILTMLSVEAMPGSGRIFVDIDNLLFWADTQQSMRTARNVAANLTKKDIEKYDFIYNIYANASIVGGPSAGAAIAVATVAALEKMKLKQDVMITGTVNHDSSIGPVGDIIAKAKAAKQLNSTLFLVPLLQSREVVYDITKHCEKFGWTDICTAEQIPRKINVENESGIKIIEVENIQEALKYMLD